MPPIWSVDHFAAAGALDTSRAHIRTLLPATDSKLTPDLVDALRIALKAHVWPVKSQNM